MKQKIGEKADYKKVELIAKVSKTLFKSRNPSRISRCMKAVERKRDSLINTSQKAIDFKTGLYQTKKVRKYWTRFT